MYTYCYIVLILALGHFLNNISFLSVQLDNVLSRRTDELDEIHKLMQKFINECIIKPLRRTVFQRDEVESAFR